MAANNRREAGNVRRLSERLDGLVAAGAMVVGVQAHGTPSVVRRLVAQQATVPEVIEHERARLESLPTPNLSFRCVRVCSTFVFRRCAKSNN